MVMSQERRAALAALMLEKRKLAAAKAAETTNVKLEDVEKSFKVAEARAKAKSETQSRKSGFFDRPEVELKVLTELKTKLLAELREPDGDGVVPPVLMRVKRVVRQDFSHNTMNGERGPLHPKLVEVRIHVLLLICYQMRESRNSAAKRMLKDHAARAIREIMPRYATDEELAYNPYKWKSVTYGKLVQELKRRGIGIREVFPDNHPIKSSDALNLICLKGLGHPDWPARINSYLYHQQSNCPMCANKRKGKRKC